jgi:hypothetical protein
MSEINETILRRLAHLEACEAIRQCVYTYALAGDRGNHAGILAELFADDATFEASGMALFSGKEAVIAGLSEIARRTVLWAFHVPAGPLIDLAADMRSARCFWWLWAPVRLEAGTGEGKPHWGAGHYNAELAEQDGQWRFRRILLETKFQTPFEGPWTEIEGEFEWPR